MEQIDGGITLMEKIGRSEMLTAELMPTEGPNTSACLFALPGIQTASL